MQTAERSVLQQIKPHILFACLDFPQVCASKHLFLGTLAYLLRREMEYCLKSSFLYYASPLHMLKLVVSGFMVRAV